MASIIILLLFTLNFLLIVNPEIVPICQILNSEGDLDEHSLIKLRRVRALCNAVQSSHSIIKEEKEENADSIPNFDLNQIETENDANQILKRFRRGRSSSSSGGGRSSSSSSSSRSSSSSSRSSSSGSRFFGGSRSSSSSSGGSRFFSRGSSSSSSSSSGGSSRIFSRSSSSSSGSGSRIFSRSSSSGGTSDTRSHRVRETVRTLIRKPTSSGSGSTGFSGSSGVKPSFTDKFRKFSHGSGSGISGSRFSSGGSSGTGGNAWVRAGKTFLPVAVRFGKRYYQRRKYNKGMYAAAGAGAGYYAGSRMHNNYNRYYPYDNYGYPPNTNEFNGQNPTVFYCLQEDLNATLVNSTLDAEGFGTCNVSGKLVTCPIEIECNTSEADTCCEDEAGTPYCCGGSIPDEYASQYGGYGDDEWGDASESIHQILNMITVICVMLTTICLSMWQRRE